MSQQPSHSQDHFITLSKAIELTTRFRSKKDQILKIEYQSQGILFTSETFSREAIESLLNQPGCVSVRHYLGMDADLKIRLVIVGADSDGNDILPSAQNNNLLETEGDIVEDGQRCPDICPPDGPLNS